MAYTRGQHRPNSNVQHIDEGEIVRPPTPAPTPEPRPVARRYICNRATIERNMEAHELFLLLDRVVTPIEVEVSAEEWGTLPPDLRRHFRAVAT